MGQDAGHKPGSTSAATTIGQPIGSTSENSQQAPVLRETSHGARSAPRRAPMAGGMPGTLSEAQPIAGERGIGARGRDAQASPRAVPLCARRCALRRRGGERSYHAAKAELCRQRDCGVSHSGGRALTRTPETTECSRPSDLLYRPGLASRHSVLGKWCATVAISRSGERRLFASGERGQPHRPVSRR